MALTERVVQADVSVDRVYGQARAKLPSRAEVVVIGAGIVGTSVARHLAALGVSDVLVLERHSLSSGTTWHPAGLLASARSNHVLTELAAASLDTYAQLQERSGIDVGFVRRGCLTLAQTPERMTELRYAADVARHHDVAVEELGPRQLVEHHPLLDPTGVIGGLRFPQDGTVSPGAATLALAKLAAADGVAFREGITVQRIATKDGRVTGVQTDQGVVACEQVALCAGLWSAELARTAGARIALHAAEHMWVLTEPLDGLRDEFPYIRDLDGHIYARPYRGALLIGAFEPNGKPRTAASIPDDFAFGEFPPDPDHFDLALSRAQERIPAVRDARIARWLNAPESFTPDGTMLLGETAETQGLFVLAGMNSQGILMGPGAAGALAEWMVRGTPTVDVAALHVSRFAAVQTGADYLWDRTRETLGRLYGMHWPRFEPETARGRRRTPLHDATAARGAVFGELGGWERPNFYAPNADPDSRVYSYETPGWFELVRAEHQAARQSAALFDLSSFAKLSVRGPGALDTVQRVFASQLEVDLGKVVYTTMLNARGGIEADVTVTRLGVDNFLVIAPSITHNRVWGWISRHAVAGSVVTDLTAAFAVLALQGPLSREILAAVTPVPLDRSAFPFGTAQRIEVRGVQVLALRVSFVGELGFELYPSADTARWVHDALLTAGEGRNLRHAGYFALDSLRSEKGFVHWGSDAGPVDTPFESGLGFTVAMEKPSFIGREALIAAEHPPARQLVPIALADPHARLFHDESVLADGRVIGHVTSGNHGYTLGTAVGLALLDANEAPSAGVRDDLEVDIAGQRVPARVGRDVLYDPSGQRMRS